MRRCLSLSCVAALCVVGGLAAPAAAQEPAALPAVAPACDEATLGPEEKVLVFSETTGFRHDSIPVGRAAICDVAGADGIAVDWTEDAAAFTAANARPSTTPSSGSPPPATRSTPPSRRRSSGYIQAGGGYAGIHAASDTEYDWAVVRRTGRRVLRQPPGRPERRRSRSSDRRAPVDRATCRSAGSASTSGTSFRSQPARRACTCSPRSTRRPTRGGRDGRRPPDRLVPRPTTAAAPGTRAAATPTSRTPSRTSASTCSAASSGRPSSADGDCGAHDLEQLRARHAGQDGGRDR